MVLQGGDVIAGVLGVLGRVAQVLLRRVLEDAAILDDLARGRAHEVRRVLVLVARRLSRGHGVGQLVGRADGRLGGVGLLVGARVQGLDVDGEGPRLQADGSVAACR